MLEEGALVIKLKIKFILGRLRLTLFQKVDSLKYLSFDMGCTDVSM